MSDLLAIGRSGIVAYRAALSTVGENVSNAETEGYTRRTVRLGESAVATSNNYQYRSSAVFGGVSVAAVQRVYDNYRSSYARLANSEAAKAEAKAAWLNTAEGALDDSQVGLGVKMASVFTAAEELSTDVSSDTNRRTMLTALNEAANQFNNTAGSLKAASDGLGSVADSAVQKLNSDLANLVKINIGLLRASPGSAGQALLLDQRDSTLKSISDAVGIEVRFEDDGRADVRLLGNSVIKLVDSSEPYPGLVGVVRASDGRLSLVASGLQTQASITAQSGSLGGLVEAAGVIASRREALDAVALSFANTLNNWNQAGIDRNGDPGAALLSGTTADDISVVTTDLSKIAAASTSGVANGNALNLKTYRNSSGPEAKWSLIVSTHAQSVSSANAEKTAAGNYRDGALQALDEVTGIDLDVEAAQLLRYQQAYSGSARIIQVAKEMLQDILGLF